MIKRTWWLGFAVLLVGGVAYAESDSPAEDPWSDEHKKSRDSDDEKSDSDSGSDVASSDRSFGNSGELAIAAERLFGFAKTNIRIKRDGPDYKTHETRVHFLLNQNAETLGHSAPRIAFDYFVGNGWSLGLSVGYSSEQGKTDTSIFELSPRFGFNYMFGAVAGVWPRVTVSYLEQRSPDPLRAKSSIIAAGGELNLLLVPAEHAFLILGPTLDATLLGKIEPNGEKKSDVTVDELGVHAGLGMFF